MAIWSVLVMLLSLVYVEIYSDFVTFNMHYGLQT